jgi:SPP1 gp7 family putative phage head morphogenesis protein
MLPARLRALSVIADGERRTGAAWWASAREFLGRVRRDVNRGGGVDPGRVSDHQQFWTDQVNVRIVPTIGVTVRGMFRRVTGRQEPPGDPWVADYLNAAGNRLVRLPDEVYALIVREVERGIQEGDDIDTVAQRIDDVLSVSASERWRNRARTVARTETMAAVNAGALRSAQLEADARGDVAPFKLWLATDDERTRPTHRAAEGQRTLLTEPFRVGGAPLMFPGDPNGPAAEVINCRCTLLPVVLGETIDWTDRQFRGTDTT